MEECRGGTSYRVRCSGGDMLDGLDCGADWRGRGLAALGWGHQGHRDKQRQQEEGRCSTRSLDITAGW